MKASAWSGCWAVGTVIPQWMPCPLDPTIWEDALALCSRETCLLWLDEYIRIHNTELAISNSLESIQIFLSKPGASCGVFTGWGVMAEQPRKRTQWVRVGKHLLWLPQAGPDYLWGRNTEEILRGVLEMLEMWAALRGKSGSGDNGLSAASERLPKQHWNTL